MNALLRPGYHGAFVADGFAHMPVIERSDTAQALAGLRLAIKDVFDVAGLKAYAGNPQWGREQPVACRHASAVQWLLEDGCEWVGKTVTDELTYSLAGVNVHYGTPANPRAPLRLPGGSSSGSAVAVAADYADIALGTDCGGSVRLPASYCGLWGIRPSHGRIASNGCFTLAHSLDTVGCFARTGAVLQATFDCLTHSASVKERPTRLLVSEDVLVQLDDSVRDAFESWLAALNRPFSRVRLGTFDLEGWARAFRQVQASEVWQQHGQWAQSRAAGFGSDVAQRFAQAALVNAEDVALANQVRRSAVECLNQVLRYDGLLLMPPVPGVAPLLAGDADSLQDTRARSQRLLCMAGLAGLPQVVMPWQEIAGAPVGLSLIGPRFADEKVLAYARTLCPDTSGRHRQVAGAIAFGSSIRTKTAVGSRGRPD